MTFLWCMVYITGQFNHVIKAFQWIVPTTYASILPSLCMCAMDMHGDKTLVLNTLLLAHIHVDKRGYAL